MMGSSAANILIVDDEQPIRDLLFSTLSPKYNCITATDVGEALDLIRSSRFDIILADEGLPGCSGLALCYYVRETAPETVAIVVSGKTDEESIAKAKRMGIYDYVCKPFNVAEIENLVERALHPGEFVAA